MEIIFVLFIFSIVVVLYAKICTSYICIANTGHNRSDFKCEIASDIAILIQIRIDNVFMHISC